MDYEIPRELETSEIKQIVQDYRQAAINALTAGFDDVELHAAFGYPSNQFLVNSVNQRSDEYGGMIDSDPTALYSFLIAELNRLKPSCVHLMQALFPLDDFPTWPKDALAQFGPLIETSIITNCGYDGISAEAILANNKASPISFGTSFIANPDLPERIANDWLLATPDKNTIYGGEMMKVISAIQITGSNDECET